MHACMLSCFSCVWLCVTPWTAAHQAPLSTGFSRQEYWSGLPFPSPEQGSLVHSYTQGTRSGIGVLQVICWLDEARILGGGRVRQIPSPCVRQEERQVILLRRTWNLLIVTTWGREGRWGSGFSIPAFQDLPCFYLLFCPWVTTESSWNGEILRRQNLQHLVTLLGMEHREELGCIPEPWLLPASPASLYSPFHPIPHPPSPVPIGFLVAGLLSILWAFCVPLGLCTSA